MTNELTDDELREAIVRHEWDQFQRTNNEGGRAACQGNWPVFHQMRLAPVPHMGAAITHQLCR